MPALEWIRPRNAVAAEAPWWVAVSDDPQFELRGWQGYEGQIVLVEVCVSTSEVGFCSSTLYFDCGQGFSEGQSLRFPSLGGNVQRMLRWPRGLRKVRFDPVEKAGRFAIEHFEVHPLSLGRLMTRARRYLCQTRGAAHGWRTMISRWLRHRGDRTALEDWLLSVCAAELELRWDRYYLQWISARDALRLDTKTHATREALSGPLVRIVVGGGKWDRESWSKLHESILAQRYANWEWRVSPRQLDQLRVTGDSSLDPRIRKMEDSGKQDACDWLCWVDGTGMLHPLALQQAMEAVGRNPRAVLIYGDEDRLASNGERFAPWFKCELNEELLLAQDYLGSLKFFRSDRAPGVAEWKFLSQPGAGYERALRLIEANERDGFLHVPGVLFHRLGPWITSRKEARVERRVVRESLVRRGIAADVAPAPEAFWLRRIRYALPAARPLVSVIIPTRDRPDLLLQCIKSLWGKSTYYKIELLVVDNGSKEAKTLGMLEWLSEYLPAQSQPGRVVRDESPFNFAALNNRAVRLSRGEILCLMNNDVESLSRGWLEEMVSLAVRPEIGAVGARLWYPDQTLQHGGMVLGMEAGTGHAHKHLARGETGHGFRAVLQQEFSAVTGACLVCRRSVYDEVGGMDESLPIAFNDVDLCLRFRRAGYRNVWTPYAELIHHESATRGLDSNPEKAARYQAELQKMRDLWPKEMERDPMYAPHLTRLREDFSVAGLDEMAGPNEA